MTTEERFWAKVAVGDECWTWTASGNGQGYGKFYASGKPVYAHRYAYELLVGRIPEGLSLDHLCRNPGCVNPDHLEPVTHAENLKRGDHFTRNAARLKTHCKHGHEFTAENTYIIPSTGSRHCRTCRRLWRGAA